MTRRQRTRAHIARHRRRYTWGAIAITAVSVLWAIASNLVAAAIAPWFGLAG